MALAGLAASAIGNAKSNNNNNTKKNKEKKQTTKKGHLQKGLIGLVPRLRRITHGTQCCLQEKANVNYLLHIQTARYPSHPHFLCIQKYFGQMSLKGKMKVDTTFRASLKRIITIPLLCFPNADKASYTAI